MEGVNAITQPSQQKNAIGSSKSSHSRDSDHSTEFTPLLARRSDQSDEEEVVGDQAQSSAASSLRRSIEGAYSTKLKASRRWPSILALSVLCLLVIAIMIGGFFAPEAIEEYSQQAMVFKPTNLSIDSFTDSGVRARVQGDFVLDASRVRKKAIRDLGRFGTWIAHEVESQETEIEVSLPESGNVILGYALIPSIKVDIRNGHKTHLDFLTDLRPGKIEGLRKVARDWVDGRLGDLRVLGKANVKLKSGILSLGSQPISQSLLIEGRDIPAMPAYKIDSIKLHEDRVPNGEEGLVAQAALQVANEYPVDLNIPPLAFEILSNGCRTEDPYIMLADAVTNNIHIQPHEDFNLNVTGFISKLPNEFLKACPGSHDSPLDSLLGEYLHGEKATIYVRGAKSSSAETPQWVFDLISGVTIPVPFTGHTFGHLIRNFSLTDVHFDLPNFWAEPNTPEAEPRISAEINALIEVPEEVNFPIGVSRVRALADVYYHDDKLGDLDLHKWQNATSKAVKDVDDDHPLLFVQSTIKNAALNITDDDVFSDVVTELLGGSTVLLTVKANVDVDVQTALGQFIVRKIPAEGMVPVKPPTGGNFKSLAPNVGDLEILSTGPTYIVLGAMVNITNPTNYSANVPYANLNLLVNGTVLGHVTTENVSFVPGENKNIPVTMKWEPSTASGDNGTATSAEFVSQWLSGYNTSITLKSHKGTIPSQPGLGKALEFLDVEIPTPKFHGPGKPGDGDGDGNDGDEDEDRPRFIQDTTMHVLTSTAEFSLFSPLKITTIYVTNINATAFYHGDVAGKILYDIPIEIPPGITQTDRLPVDWNIGGVGYGAIKKALGGTLKLDAYAIVGLRIENYEMTVWFAGRGIGAKVRI